MGHRVLIFVQHLRGIGHLQRAATLARALAADGVQVDFVSGGMPVPEIGLDGVTLHQLPALRSPDDSYTRLVDAQGREATPALNASRRKALVGIFQATRPDAVMVEMFPFGRSQIKAEMVALVEAARAAVPRPLVISSVRDIIAAKLGVPHMYKFELLGTPEDVSRVREGLEQFWQKTTPTQA